MKDQRGVTAILVIIILVFISSIAFYFLKPKFMKNEVVETPQVATTVTNTTEKKLPSGSSFANLLKSKDSMDSEGNLNSEIAVSDNLKTCTKYKTSFKHLITGETLQKEILGIVDGKCKYIEEMPNEEKMECKYTESERIAVSEYYKSIANSDSYSTEMESDHMNDINEVMYFIDGKEVENPLQEVIDTGTCVISGYE